MNFVIRKYNSKYEFDKVCDWIWSEWSNDYIKYTCMNTKKLFYEYYSSLINIYVIYVIVDSEETDELIGCFIIDDWDMGVRVDLKPWLTNLYIKEDFRRRSIGSEALEYVLKIYPVIHLWTYTQELRDYYLKRGFKVVDNISWGDYEHVFVMKAGDDLK